MLSEAVDILKQYNQSQALEQQNILKTVDSLRKENKELKRIVKDISELITLTSFEAMIEYIISKFLDHFIPENLFILIKPPRKRNFRQYYYKRLILQDSYFDESDYVYLKDSLDDISNENSIIFMSDFDMLYGKDLFPAQLKKLNPEIIIPLSAIGGAFGFVLISKKITGESYSPIELNYMKRLFSVFSVVLQNGLHYETSIKDPKTGLFTSDYFFTRLKECISTTQRYKVSSGMLMLDIDFFKKFNDTYGHLVGDKVLIEIAKVLQASVRSEDCVARFGGEEFSIILNQCTSNSIFTVAERIRKNIEKISLFEKGEELKITVSIGGCLIEAINFLTPKYIVKKADQALYESKHNGRNRSTILKMGLLDRASLKKDLKDNPSDEDDE